MSERRYAVLREVVKGQDALLPRGVVVPPVLDVALWEPIRIVIEDLPIEAEAERSLFDDVVSGLREFIIVWNRGRSRDMFAVLQRSKPDATEADLRQPSTLFQCETFFALLVECYFPIPPFCGIHAP